MKYLAIVVVALFGLATVSCARVRYDNYHVYQVLAETKEQLEALTKLDVSREAYIFLDGLHFLKSKINVVVAPKKILEFENVMSANGIAYELVDSNAQASLEDDVVADPKRAEPSEYKWTEYYELNDTYNWMRSLAVKYPKIVSTFVAGSTYEGREILGLKISYGPGRRGVFLEAGIHAREWIGPAAATYITNELLTSQAKETRLIAEHLDWYIVPHANPDGFVYTHTTDRMWRKTRSPQGDCFGADPNRNWAFHWNEVGSSNNSCSDTFAGPSPFSEMETKALSDYIVANLKDKIQTYISLHSFSQLLLFPYGHTAELPPNYDDLKRVFDVALAAISKRYGTKYKGGNIYDAIYPASGASIDWAYGTQDIKYAYCYELRPSSPNLWNGFKLPASKIIPTGEETLDSITAMLIEIGLASFM